MGQCCVDGNDDDDAADDGGEEHSGGAGNAGGLKVTDGLQESRHKPRDGTEDDRAERTFRCSRVLSVGRLLSGCHFGG